MKKIYTLVAGIFLASTVIAQTTTKDLVNHTTGAFTGFTQTGPFPAFGTLSWNGGEGYINGTNDFGDQAVVQLFDEAAGITGAGTINSISFLVDRINIGSADPKYKVGIWENNNGVIGALITSNEYSLLASDTAIANMTPLMDGTVIGGLKNVTKTFSGVSIPANKSFWAGVILPTTKADGDTMTIAMSLPPAAFGGTVPANYISYTYPKTATHSGVMEETGLFGSYQPYVAGATNFVYVNITSTSLSVDELSSNHSLNVFPNPATDVLNFTVVDAEISMMNIFSTDGKLVSSTQFSNVQSGQVNISDLNAGIYLYEVVAANGATSNSKFIKK